jgi:hypothetical protein
MELVTTLVTKMLVGVVGTPEFYGDMIESGVQRE